MGRASGDVEEAFLLTNWTVPRSWFLEGERWLKKEEWEGASQGKMPCASPVTGSRVLGEELKVKTNGTLESLLVRSWGSRVSLDSTGSTKPTKSCTKSRVHQTNVYPLQDKKMAHCFLHRWGHPHVRDARGCHASQKTHCTAGPERRNQKCVCSNLSD